MLVNPYKLWKKDTACSCRYKANLRSPTFSFRPFLCLTFAEKQKLRATNINIF